MPFGTVGPFVGAPSALFESRVFALMRRGISAEFLLETMDRPTFERMFAEYAPRIQGYFLRQGLNRSVAEEVVQEVMLALWRHADSFDPDKGSMSTWVFTVARNRLVDSVRRQRRPTPDPDDPCWVGDRPAQGPSPETATVELGRARALRVAVDQLPAEQRRVLDALYFEGKSMNEFAQATGIPLGTVKSRARLALRALRERMAEGNEK